MSSLYERAFQHRIMRKLAATPYAAKVTKYAIGSLIALGTSIVVFALMYVALGGKHTTICSIGAFVAGAVPNWVLNRRWAWKIRGQVEFLREIVAYVAISGVVLVASSLGTGAMQSWVKGHVSPHHGIRVILVTAAYVFVQAVLFVAKFVIYERWVFSGRSRVRAALRSRRQVWTAARANPVAEVPALLGAGGVLAPVTHRGRHLGQPVAVKRRRDHQLRRLVLGLLQDHVGGQPG